MRFEIIAANIVLIYLNQNVQFKIFIFYYNFGLYFSTYDNSCSCTKHWMNAPIFEHLMVWVPNPCKIDMGQEKLH